MDGTAGRGGAFFGRRKGKQLRARQEDLIATLLPALRLPVAGAPGGGRPRPVVTDPAALFPNRPDRIVLEIGFGGGEHLLAEAPARPAIGFIGVEPFVNGMAKCLSGIADGTIRNIRLWDGDAVDLLAALPDASIDLVHLLYPDPWPKRRQRKRRFTSRANLAALARVLKPGGELRVATDIDDYAGSTLARIGQVPAFAWAAEDADAWRKPWPGWTGTRYESKARREGRVPIYLTFNRV